jgi:biopolymer transport protein ExbB/TolQ
MPLTQNSIFGIFYAKLTFQAKRFFSGEDNMIDFFTQGGPFMYPILFGSIIAAAIALERYFVLMIKYQLNHRALISKVIEFVRHDKHNSAITLCERNQSHPVARVLKAGLLKSDKCSRDVASTMEEETVRMIPVVEKRVGYLSVIGNIATLLGLLGTIFGLIAAFEAVGLASAAEKQQKLAEGISQAMSTTAFGLIVAIPSMFLHYFLNNKANEIIDAMDESSLALTNQVSNTESRSKRVA